MSLVATRYAQAEAFSAPGDAAAFAAVVQGFDAGEAFQAAEIFSGDGAEGIADAADGAAPGADISEAGEGGGSADVDRACIVPGAVHGFECADRSEFCQLAFFVEADQAVGIAD